MKKSSKRKMYQKRRKKEKAEQKRKASQTTKLPETTKTTAASFCKNNNNNNKQNQRYIQNYHQLTHNNHRANPINAYSQGLQLWWQTYCSAIEFHSKQQNLWRDENKQREIMLLERYAKEYETSSEEDEEESDVDEYDTMQYNTNIDDNNMVKDNVDEADNVDEEYIKFLEITHRHRQELRLKRAQENI